MTNDDLYKEYRHVAEVADALDLPGEPVFVDKAGLHVEFAIPGGGGKSDFAQRSAECEECEPTNQEEAKSIMKSVAMGNTLPEKHWCDAHVRQFMQETVEWRESEL